MKGPIKPEYLPQAEQLCTQLLTSLLSVVKEDGSIGNGDEDVLSHHLLLVLGVWNTPAFSGMIERTTKWFLNLSAIDIRENRERQFNPFKLFAFAYLNRDATSGYVANKIDVLRKYFVKSQGYAVLQLGFTLAGDVQEVFPTLMAADLLITEGSAASLEVAKKTIEWSFREIVNHAVYENLSSILGFAAMVGTKYFIKTGEATYQANVHDFIEMIAKTQKNGIWEDNKYQSSYIFYDLAYIWSVTNNPLLEKIIDDFLKNVFLKGFFDEQVWGQNGIIVISSLLRGFGILLSDESREKIVNGVTDAAFRATATFRNRENVLATGEAIVGKIMRDLQERRILPINPTIFTSREFKEDKQQIFVLMPYGRKTWYRTDPKMGDMLQRNEYDFDIPFKNLIAPVVEELNLRCVRADSIFDPKRNIMEKIWIEINESALIIADVTSMNPNVLYELGVAHTLGKPIIIITQDDSYVPTDLKSIEYIKYNPQLGLEEELKKKLKDAILQTLAANQ